MRRLALVLSIALLASPAAAQNLLQSLFWNEQTKSCVNAVKSELGVGSKGLRYLEIENVDTSNVERTVKPTSPPVRVSGVMDIEGVFTVGDDIVECVMMKNQIEVGQKPAGSLPRQCLPVLDKLEREVQWHDSLGFRLTDGRSSRAKLQFACQFSDPSTSKVHFFEPLKGAGR